MINNESPTDAVESAKNRLLQAMKVELYDPTPQNKAVSLILRRAYNARCQELEDAQEKVIAALVKNGHTLTKP